MTIKFRVGDVVKVTKIVQDYQYAWFKEKAIFFNKEQYSGIRTSFKNYIGEIIEIRDVGKLVLSIPSIKIKFNLSYDDYYIYIFYPDEIIHASKEEIEYFNAKDIALKI